MIAKVQRFLPLAILTALCLAAGSVAADRAAADDSRQFVEALRQRGYLDTAANYLEDRSKDSKLPAQTRHSLELQQAAVLIDGAAAINDPQQRGWQLDQAQAKLRQFLAASPDDPEAQTARQRLAALLRYRADALMQQTNKSGAISTANRKQAAAMYAEARALYDDEAKHYRADLDKIPKGEQPDQREQLGNSWLGSLLDAATVTFDQARASESGGADARKLFTDAAGQCKKLHEDYPKRLVGVTARFYEGRCYQDLGDSKSALAAYDDLFSGLPDGDASLRQLKTQALRYAMQCWIQDKDYSTAVDKSLAWAKSAAAPNCKIPIG